MRLPGTQPTVEEPKTNAPEPTTKSKLPAFSFDPIALVALMLSRWRLLALTVILFTLLAYFYAKSAPYVYRAAARVEVFQENRLRDDGRLNEYDKLESEANRHIIIMSGEIFHNDLQAKLRPKWENRLPEDEMEVPFQIKTVSRSKSMIDLYVDSSNREYAMDYLQGILGSYRNHRQNELRQVNENALSGLHFEEMRIQSKLSEVKARIEHFETENQILIAQEREEKHNELLDNLLGRLQSIQVERSILENQYREIIDTDIATIRANLAVNQDSYIREFLLDYASQNQVNIAEQDVQESIFLNDVPLSSQTTLSWEQQEDLLATLENEYTKRLEVFRTTHPKMQELQQQMDALRRSLDKKLEIAVRRFQARYQALQRKEASLENVINELQQKTNLTTDKKNQYILLKRQEAQLQSKYDMVYQRILANAGSLDNLTLITIQEPYIWENPIAPNKIKLLAIGPVVGLFFGVFCVLVKGVLFPIVATLYKQYRTAAPIGAVVISH